MSNTKYARDRMLRMDAAEQQALLLCVMTRLELLTSGDIEMLLPEDEVKAHLRHLRSLLERLSD